VSKATEHHCMGTIQTTRLNKKTDQFSAVTRKTATEDADIKCWGRLLKTWAVMTRKAWTKLVDNWLKKQSVSNTVVDNSGVVYLIN